MTDDEVWAFVEEQKSLQVATINADGSPHLSTLWFAVVDGAIVFETYRKSQKVVNLQRDDRIACLLEDGDQYDLLRGVQINGRADIVTDQEEIFRLAEAVMVRNQPEVPAEHLSAAARVMAAKRVGIIVRPSEIVTWDHTKLG